MASLSEIKNWFKTGFKPTQTQFWITWDSFWHKDTPIPQDAIEDLGNTLSEKADLSRLEEHINDTEAHSGGSGYIPTLEQVIATTGIRSIVSANEIIDLQFGNYEEVNQTRLIVAGENQQHQGSGIYLARNTPTGYAKSFYVGKSGFTGRELLEIFDNIDNKGITTFADYSAAQKLDDNAYTSTKAVKELIEEFSGGGSGAIGYSSSAVWNYDLSDFSFNPAVGFFKANDYAYNASKLYFNEIDHNGLNAKSLFHILAPGSKIIMHGETGESFIIYNVTGYDGRSDNGYHSVSVSVSTTGNNYANDWSSTTVTGIFFPSLGGSDSGDSTETLQQILDNGSSATLIGTVADPKDFSIMSYRTDSGNSPSYISVTGAEARMYNSGSNVYVTPNDAAISGGGATVKVNSSNGASITSQGNSITMPGNAMNFTAGGNLSVNSSGDTAIQANGRMNLNSNSTIDINTSVAPITIGTSGRTGPLYLNSGTFQQNVSNYTATSTGSPFQFNSPYSLYVNGKWALTGIKVGESTYDATNNDGTLDLTSIIDSGGNSTPTMQQVSNAGNTIQANGVNPVLDVYSSSFERRNIISGEGFVSQQATSAIDDTPEMRTLLYPAGLVHQHGNNTSFLYWEDLTATGALKLPDESGTLATKEWVTNNISVGDETPTFSDVLTASKDVVGTNPEYRMYSTDFSRRIYVSPTVGFQVSSGNIDVNDNLNTAGQTANYSHLGISARSTTFSQSLRFLDEGLSNKLLHIPNADGTLATQEWVTANSNGENIPTLQQVVEAGSVGIAPFIDGEIGLRLGQSNSEGELQGIVCYPSNVNVQSSYVNLLATQALYAEAQTGYVLTTFGGDIKFNVPAGKFNVNEQEVLTGNYGTATINPSTGTTFTIPHNFYNLYGNPVPSYVSVHFSKYSPDLMYYSTTVDDTHITITFLTLPTETSLDVYWEVRP